MSKSIDTYLKMSNEEWDRYSDSEQKDDNAAYKAFFYDALYQVATGKSAKEYGDSKRFYGKNWESQRAATVDDISDLIESSEIPELREEFDSFIKDMNTEKTTEDSLVERFKEEDNWEIGNEPDNYQASA